ncbi:hypothetical protein [Stenotrophomonas sp. DR822]|uniref:hypothetical protein n=1 Tax=Stenotrophomonas sp. DR822 TaxID=2871174 RepID=UPI0021BBCA0C|nr:hypothetical protein [Stenotrophomonas sp. DR822]
MTGKLRKARGEPSQRPPAGYFRQQLAVRLASLPWLLLCVVVLADTAWMPLALGVALALATGAGALFLADYLIRRRAAGGERCWLIVFLGTPVLALLCL